MCTDLVEASGLRRRLYKAYLTEFRVGTCFEGFELGLGGVGAWYDGLAHIDLAGLMLAESVERLIDNPRFRWASMDEGEVTFLNFTSLLHFAEDGSVFLASPHKKQATGFSVQPADQRKEFIWVLVAKPVDQGESAIGSGGVNQPAGRFIDDEKILLFGDNGWGHLLTFWRRKTSTTFFSTAPWLEIRETTLDIVDAAKEDQLGLPVARKRSPGESYPG